LQAFDTLTENIIDMRLPAEWEKQSGVQLTWPDGTTPWYEIDKVIDCYVRIASAIASREKLLVVTTDPAATKLDIAVRAARMGVRIDVSSIIFTESPINDTWARDHGGIAVHGDGGEKYLYDFVFNGWGLKFASNLDNQITKKIFFDGTFASDVMLVDMRPFVLEGGSIESDGEGTLLATTECLTSLNRNEYLSREEIDGELSQAFGLERVLWLDSGSIEGDDTDSHVDILARFASPDTILYVKCEDPDDPNFGPLSQMEEQLKGFLTLEGEPYTLIPLPLPPKMYLEGYRLPASYANFLILNGAVLMPGAGDEKTDAKAAEILSGAFPGREIVTIDCRPLLSGHGGLHCVTMQFPEGWL